MGAGDVMNPEYLGEFDEKDGYLDFASIGPPSKTARAASAVLLDAIADGGCAPDAVLGPAYADARAEIAAALGVADGFATSVPSTSAGIMQVAFGLVGAGGNVVVPSHEFPANRYPWIRAAGVGGPEVRFVDVPSGRVTPDALAGAIDADTRLVAVSLVDYLTGVGVDVDAIVEAAGNALILVDGIQALGGVEAVLGSADVFVAGGQKWLRAGFGSGVMAASLRAIERLAPTLTGWWGVDDNFAFDVAPPHLALETADRFLESSPNASGAVAAAAALRVCALAGIDEIEEAVLVRSGMVLEAARSLGAEVIAPWRTETERSGISTFRFPTTSSAAVVAALADDGFIVSERNGWIRVAPHATTPIPVIEAFEAAIAIQARNA